MGWIPTAKRKCPPSQMVSSASRGVFGKRQFRWQSDHKATINKGLAGHRLQRPERGARIGNAVFRQTLSITTGTPPGVQLAAGFRTLVFRRDYRYLSPANQGVDIAYNTLR